ncbi:MAG: DUF2520 domain-containing protein [Flavobacteriales bacterium]|nr:DUF2520 domain-containing protein [Crocinitomicaceae bacterium]NBX80392.1 DUF2520 domain-containing protein [Flavobacteriales bacterium]NCA19723.1 DUF2520 domain-containing protein [Crocinitomicaceae bacterium]
MITICSEIISVAFVGSGKVANGLAEIFHSNDIHITGISSRNIETGKVLAAKVEAPFFDSALDLNADLIIVAVADQFVTDVVNSFSNSQLVAFTAGSVSLEDLKEVENRAVFYPLQTFTEERSLTVKQIPILLEASSNEVGESLLQLCTRIGFNFQFCDSNKRKKIHLSAVFLNNFVNHLVYLAQNEASKNQVDWAIFEPLLEETFEKLKLLSPFEAQTGPAKRHDQLIINEHLELLDGRKKEIYKILSESITEIHSKK